MKPVYTQVWLSPQRPPVVLAWVISGCTSTEVGSPVSTKAPESRPSRTPARNSFDAKPETVPDTSMSPAAIKVIGKSLDSEPLSVSTQAAGVLGVVMPAVLATVIALLRTGLLDCMWCSSCIHQ